MKKYRIPVAVLSACLLAGALSACGPGENAKETPKAVGSSNYDDLVGFFKEWRAFQLPKFNDGVPDYTPAAMGEQKLGLEKLRARLVAFDTSRWTVSQLVDYHLIRAEMNGLDFDHRVLRPWSRDPAFYVTTPVEFGPRMEGWVAVPRSLPVPPDRLPELKLRLQAVPKILEQAKGNLAEPAADLAALAIHAKDKEIQIYKDLASKLAAHHPDLVGDAENAARACESFRSWLEETKGKMNPRAGVGVEDYNWYLKNVQLFPYTWDEVRVINDREFQRAMAFLKLEENRNRTLPRLEPAETEAEYLRRHEEAEKEFMKFVKEQEIMTIPDYFKLRKPGPFTPPGPGGVRDVFRQTGDRDPLPMFAHESIGHDLDAQRLQHDTRPIRGVPRTPQVGRLYFIDGIRAEALATGLEEDLMHAGLLDKRPRSRELTYILLATRTVRAATDLKVHSHELNLTQAMDYLAEKTPYGYFVKNSETMWHDLGLYFRVPGYGIGYVMGKIQLERLMADRGAQLGDKFNLRQFLDDFVASGMIPVSLTRWEMTGLDDEIKKLW